MKAKEKIAHLEELKRSHLRQIAELEEEVRSQLEAVHYYLLVQKKWEDWGILGKEYRYAKIAIEGIGYKITDLRKEIESKESTVRFLENKIQKEEGIS